jgi:putative phosphoesterase
VRVAALYDVHGNLPALEAVLGEVDREGVDAIVSGGDVAAGPMPSECVARLRDRDVAWVRGNADRNVRGWAAERLSEQERSFLTTLPATQSLEVDGLGTVLFCHSTPRSDEVYFLETTDEEVAAGILGELEEPVAVCGHTHMQFDREIRGTRVVNAGSVGMPYEAEPGAYWALLGPQVELRRTAYDVEAAIEAILATGWPEADEFTRENVRTVPSRAEALSVFEPGVGLPFPYGRAT